MLMCSFVHFYFVCEHLFTFQFCALMPEISKENFAKYRDLRTFVVIFWARKSAARKSTDFCNFAVDITGLYYSI